MFFKNYICVVSFCFFYAKIKVENRLNAEGLGDGSGTGAKRKYNVQPQQMLKKILTAKVQKTKYEHTKNTMGR